MRSPGKHAALTLHFQAEDVYLVLGGHGKVTVPIDGKPTKTVDVGSYKLYTLRSGSKPTQRPADARVHARRPGLRLHLRLGRRYCSPRAELPSPPSCSRSRRKRVSSAASVSPDGSSVSSSISSARLSSSST